jgi:hypothetical protein
VDNEEKIYICSLIWKFIEVVSLDPPPSIFPKPKSLTKATFFFFLPFLFYVNDFFVFANSVPFVNICEFLEYMSVLFLT